MSYLIRSDVVNFEITYIFQARNMSSAIYINVSCYDNHNTSCTLLLYLYKRDIEVVRESFLRVQHG